jgi:hypothetical protein
MPRTAADRAGATGGCGRARMNLMTRFAAALLLAPALCAQLATDVFRKAPPVVEEALRARIQQFYQLQVEGKGRQAEALVAEDTKDYYYSSGQPKYAGFSIESIEWSEDFTRAKATLICHTYVMMPGFADKPLPVPTPSYWRLEDGQWVWYVDEAARNMTPFGRMRPGEAGGAPTAIPAMPTPEEAMKLIQRVTADKTAVTLDPAKPSSDQVTISNPLPGAVTIKVSVPELQGLEVQVAEPAIKPGEKTAVIFRYKPGKTRLSAPATAIIHVETTGQSFPIQIRFAN